MEWGWKNLESKYWNSYIEQDSLDFDGIGNVHFGKARSRFGWYFSVFEIQRTLLQFRSDDQRGSSQGIGGIHFVTALGEKGQSYVVYVLANSHVHS